MDQVLELIRSELDSGQCLGFGRKSERSMRSAVSHSGFRRQNWETSGRLSRSEMSLKGPRDDGCLQAGRLLLPDNSLPPVKPDGVRLKRTIHCEAKADITSARVGYGTRYTSTQPGMWPSMESLTRYISS